MVGEEERYLSTSGKGCVSAFHVFASQKRAFTWLVKQIHMFL
jgi:hypothetical protein